MQNGFVRNPDEFVGFLRENLWQGMKGGGPFVRAVFLGGDVAELDRLLDSMLANHVANRASRVQGRALLSIVQRAFAEISPGPWKTDGELPGHFAVVFGLLEGVEPGGGL